VSGTIQAVSAVDRFKERFLKLYGPKMDRRRRIEETWGNFNLVMQHIAATQSLVEQP